jgi:copper homeostasis protein
MHLPLQLEICVDSPDGLRQAVAGGADRIELCSALGLGGLTPSPGMIAAARECPLPCHAMIRPVPGDFVPRDGGIEAVLADIAAIRAAGLAGVVIGVMTPSGDLDAEALMRCRDVAGGMDVTIHRAIDICRDQMAALEVAISCGAVRILTSGTAPTAIQGADRIAALCAMAEGRIEIMAGSGVDDGNARALMATGVDALHSSCAEVDVRQQDCSVIGIAPRKVTTAARVRSLKIIMEGGR